MGPITRPEAFLSYINDRDIKLWKGSWEEMDR